MLTIADGGGRGGVATPVFGWRNMWTAPNLIIIVERLKAALLKKNSTAKINEWSTSMYLKYVYAAKIPQLKYLYVVKVQYK